MTLTVLLSWALVTSTDYSGAWFLGCTQKSISHLVMTIKQVLFTLKMLNVLTHLYAVLLWIIIQQSWHHFYADFPQIQIFGDNLPNTVLFFVQLTLII